jgi:hypothetical protein
VDADVRERWLSGAPLGEPTSRSEHSARFDWEDGVTGVVVGFQPTSDTESQVTVSHERFADSPSADEEKEHWGQRLATLKDLLEA